MYQYSAGMLCCPKEPCDAVGVLGIKFADIINYRPKVAVVGLTCKDSKEEARDSTGNCHCRQPHCH